MRASPLLLFLLATVASSACSGEVVPVVDELVFAPQEKSAGYGYVGGMHVLLVDPSSDRVLRRLTLQAKDLSGDFSVAAGTVTVSLVEQRSDGTIIPYGTVSGTVSIEGTAGSPQGEQVEVDLVFASPGEPWREHHIAGAYVASLDYEG